MGSKYVHGGIQTCLLAAVLLMNSAAVLAFDHQHQMLTQVLSDVVKLSPNKKQSRVDYGLLFKQPNKLNEYLAVLSSVKKSEYALWTRDEQLSFFDQCL